MEELIKTIKDKVDELKVNLMKAENGFRAAAKRARKNTLDLEKLFKEYRKTSIEEEKKK